MVLEGKTGHILSWEGWFAKCHCCTILGTGWMPLKKKKKKPPASPDCSAFARFTPQEVCLASKRAITTAAADVSAKVQRDYSEQHT